ncbi:MAG: hypothetical protein IJA32_15220 [Lachnospiraceae bacterium]|nr:hypothetical protein [Lachnospiraceae bacterium]
MMKKKVCLMKCGYHDSCPEYKFRVEFFHALFLFIEEEIVVVEMGDWGGWIDMVQIFAPSSLAEKEEEIKKVIEDMYTVMFYGKRKGNTSSKITWDYEGYKGYVCYDREI